MKTLISKNGFHYLKIYISLKVIEMLTGDVEKNMLL